MLITCSLWQLLCKKVAREGSALLNTLSANLLHQSLLVAYEAYYLPNYIICLHLQHTNIHKEYQIVLHRYLDVVTLPSGPKYAKDFLLDLDLEIEEANLMFQYGVY